MELFDPGQIVVDARPVFESNGSTGSRPGKIIAKQKFKIMSNDMPSHKTALVLGLGLASAILVIHNSILQFLTRL